MFVRQAGPAPSPRRRARWGLLDSANAYGLGLPVRPVSATVGWAPWKHLPGVVDLAGRRSDGQLVAAAAGGLFLGATDGAIAPFAAGQGGYQVASGPEAYFDVSPGLHVVSANCDFTRDVVFAIR